jgi:riboflavin kinase/FMN adenylyltransferase
MPGVVAVGFFDGVHLGHRRILEGADAALTFRNHPSSVLRPESAKTLLMPYSEKEEFIRACGVKNVIALDFTPELASMSPERFIDFIASFSKVRCGADWRFGKGAKGDAEFLRERGFEVEVVPYTELDGERISSTRIREALAKGDLTLANQMLGRNWSVAGELVRGKGVGRELGYPTVNLMISKSLPELPAGVYEVSAFGVKAIANFGYAPTMGDAAWKEKTLEIHFKGDCPAELIQLVDGSGLKVEFVRFIRPERKFETLDELKAQIAVDCGMVWGF